jgi:decaprenylphospho-beta-D-ribofuranose 2-oxidase
MSVSDLAHGTQNGVERELSGWGRIGSSRASVVRPGNAEEAAAAISDGVRAGRAVIARGAGRSYGDAAQSDQGVVLDMTGMNRVISVDATAMTVTAQAGATLAALMTRLYAHDMTLPVVPGTRHVTLAGAIASDIHGKNHHRDGAFARHVEAITLLTAAGDLLELSAEQHGELFYATLGGMGLTGVIIQATARAERLSSPWVAEDLDRTNGLEQTLELIGGEEPRRYSVAWLDMLADGPRMGRALVSRADPLPAGVTPPVPRRGSSGSASYPGSLLRAPALQIPRRVPRGVLRPSLVRAFNAARWRASPSSERGRPLGMAPYFFPLDGVGAWNRLYGPDGFIQYQFALPTGEVSALRRCFQVLRKLPVYLAVFKRFGPRFGGPLSFPIEGWTLAVDIPGAAPGLRASLDRLDDMVAEAGGRVYLSKDIRLRRDHLQAMYPDLERFRSQRAHVDPDGVVRSDLGTRLGLCGAVL